MTYSLIIFFSLTQEQNKEVEDTKSLLLDSYSMVEDCKMREQRNFVFDLIKPMGITGNNIFKKPCKSVVLILVFFPLVI
jgi:hypothetical protein